jgi:outer membrane receptor protein involved in Fe transport
MKPIRPDAATLLETLSCRFRTRAGAAAWGRLQPALAGLAVALLCSSGLAAEADSAEADLSLDRYYKTISLSELIDMKTVVASAREERTSDAPGAVTAYADQDIERFGYRTLVQLADLTPGYASLIDKDGNARLETRGGLGTGNEKHLILIDGIPVNHARGNRAPGQQELPLLFAQRVEFLRGPASALYGLGAFNGVINIVPKALPHDGAIQEVRMGVGLESGTRLDGEQLKREWVLHRNQWGEYNIAKWFNANSVVRSDGKEFQLGYGYYSRAASMKYGLMMNWQTMERDTSVHYGPNANDGMAQFGRIQARLTDGPLAGAGLGCIALYRENGYGMSWTQSTAIPSVSNFVRWVTIVPYVRFDRALTNKVHLQSYAKFNFSQERGLQANTFGWWAPVDTAGLFQFDVAADNFEFKATCDWSLAEQVGIIAGVNFDMRGQDSARTYSKMAAGQWSGYPNFIRLYNGTAYTYSGFLQAHGELPLLNGLRLTAGVRSDNGNLQGNTYNNFSPRCAAVLRIMDYLNFKAMYATALKAPGQDNYSTNQEQLPDLEKFNRENHTNFQLRTLRPENIRTFETNLTFSMNTVYASASGFYNIITDAIEHRVWWTSGLSNLPELDQNVNYTMYATGGELELRYAPWQFLRLWAGGSYTRTYANFKAGDTLPPDRKVALADTTIDYVIGEIPAGKSYLGVNYTAPWGMSVSAALKSIWKTTKLKLSTGLPLFYPGYSLLDLTLQQPVGEYLVVELGVNNLLNEQYFYGDNGIQVPGDNRSISLSVNSKF